jgi:U5 snRNP protein, DIM1 family
MSFMIPHLPSAWHVDQAIMSEEERLVVIRFGRDSNPDCMRQDEILYRIAERVKNFAVIYLCDNVQVPDFNSMYELYDPMTIMFFFRNKYVPPLLVGLISRACSFVVANLSQQVTDFSCRHMMCDFGTGNNNKLNWVLEDKQELIDIVEAIYRGAKKGRGLVVSPKDYSTRYRY